MRHRLLHWERKLKIRNANKNLVFGALSMNHLVKKNRTRILFALLFHSSLSCTCHSSIIIISSDSDYVIAEMSSIVMLWVKKYLIVCIYFVVRTAMPWIIYQLFSLLPSAVWYAPLQFYLHWDGAYAVDIQLFDNNNTHIRWFCGFHANAYHSCCSHVMRSSVVASS